MTDPIVIGLTSGGTFLLAFLLFSHPQNNNIKANRMLGIFIFTLALSMLEIFLNTLNIQVKYPALFELIGLSRFLSAPALFMSVVYFTSISKSLQIKDAWHLVPFFLFVIYSLPYLLTGVNINLSQSGSKIIFPIIANALPCQSVFYWYFSFKKLQKHQKNIQQISSSIDTINLLWLTKFLLIIGCIVLIWFNLLFFKIEDLFNITPFLYLICIYFLAYFSLRQKEIFGFKKVELIELNNVLEENDNLKSEKHKRLSDSQIQSEKNKLDQLMADKKIYLDNEISLPSLANLMNLSYHETSYLINECYGENFYSFVNKYRVAEAKRLLLSESIDQLNILGIAFQSGFNSKTTFNTTFKKMSGLSPTEFIKSMNIQNKVNKVK